MVSMHPNSSSMVSLRAEPGGARIFLAVPFAILSNLSQPAAVVPR